MSASRYYFSNFIEDDTLSVLAVTAKEMIQQIDSIVKIYEKNNEELYGQSPKQIMFLMKQNNKPLYTLGEFSSLGNSSCSDKSNLGQSTPVARNSDIFNLPRILIPDVQLDAGKMQSHSGTLDSITPIRRRAEKKDAAILNPAHDETDKVDEQFSTFSPIGSPESISQDSPRSEELTEGDKTLPTNERDNSYKSKHSRILNRAAEKNSKADKNFGSPVGSADNPKVTCQDYPPSSEIVMMSESLAMDDKATGSPVKITGNTDADNKQSPRTAELIGMTDCLTMDGKDSSPVLVRGISELISSNKELMGTVEKSKMTSSLILDEKEAIHPVEEERIDTNATPCNSGGKSGKSPHDSSKKDSLSPVEVIFKIPKVRCETPSPIKKSKTIISAVGIQEFANSTENSRLADSSPENTEVSVGTKQGNTTNISPSEVIQGIDLKKRKRKSTTPKRRISTLFRSIPRVVQSAGKAETDIEVPYDSEDNPSPTTSRISSTANSPKGRSPMESQSDDSPKTLRRFLSPSKRASFFSSPSNASEISTSSTEDDKDSIASNTLDMASNTLDIASNTLDISKAGEMATGDQSCKLQSRLTYDDTKYFEIKYTILKFNTLYTLRYRVLKKIFASLLCFQNSIGFLNNYVQTAGYIVQTIPLLDNQYSTMELKETVDDAIAIASKLAKKLTAWKTDIDQDVDTWNKCFEELQELKTDYEPLQTVDGKPLISIETLQVYEYELKTIWQKMDDMIMMGDTRRSLFSQTAYDFKLIKFFVKCLILVGVLQPR